MFPLSKSATGVIEAFHNGDTTLAAMILTEDHNWMVDEFKKKDGVTYRAIRCASEIERSS